MTCFVCIESACEIVSVCVVTLIRKNCNRYEARTVCSSFLLFQQCEIGSGCHSVGPLGVIVIFSWFFFSLLLLFSSSFGCFVRKHVTICFVIIERVVQERYKKSLDGFSSCCCCCCFLCSWIACSVPYSCSHTHNLHLILIEIFFALTKEMWTACYFFLSCAFTILLLCIWSFFCLMRCSLLWHTHKLWVTTHSQWTSGAVAFSLFSSNFHKQNTIKFHIEIGK